MKVYKLRTFSFALILALFGLTGVVIAEDKGCVTCHAGEMALNTILTERVENHMDVGPMVNTVPTDCLMCHASGSETSLMEPLHSRHEGAEGVTCDSCHELDADSGMPTALKAGAKNW